MSEANEIKIDPVDTRFHDEEVIAAVEGYANYLVTHCLGGTALF